MRFPNETIFYEVSAFLRSAARFSAVLACAMSRAEDKTIRKDADLGAP